MDIWCNLLLAASWLLFAIAFSLAWARGNHFSDEAFAAKKRQHVVEREKAQLDEELQQAKHAQKLLSHANGVLSGKLKEFSESFERDTARYQQQLEHEQAKRAEVEAAYDEYQFRVNSAINKLIGDR